MPLSPRNRSSIVAALSLTLGTSFTVASAAHAQQAMSSDARKYILQVVNKMRERAVNRDAIDWKQLESKAMAAAPNAQTIRETFPAIKAALNELNDKRAGYRAATGELITADLTDCALPTVIKQSQLPANVGYLRLMPEPAANLRVMSDIATRIQTEIRDGDASGKTAWIIDLRAFRQGVVGSPLVGLGPLLGDQTAFYTFDVNGTVTPYSATADRVTIDKQPILLGIPRFKMVHEKPKIAVLIGPATAGAGEMLAIAFTARDNARTFGAATCGMPPFVSPVNALSDGAKLYINPVIIADRNRKRYFGPLEPDEKVDGADQIFESAIKWLGEAR